MNEGDRDPDADPAADDQDDPDGDDLPDTIFLEETGGDPDDPGVQNICSCLAACLVHVCSGLAPQPPAPKPRKPVPKRATRGGPDDFGV